MFGFLPFMQRVVVLRARWARLVRGLQLRARWADLARGVFYSQALRKRFIVRRLQRRLRDGRARDRAAALAAMAASRTCFGVCLRCLLPSADKA